MPNVCECGTLGSRFVVWNKKTERLTQASVHCELKWLHSKALSTLGAWEPLPGYRHKMVFTPWVHSYSISHCHTPFSNISLAASKKVVDYPRTNRKGMHTWCLCPLLVLTLYLDTGAVPEFYRGYLKKRCVHISAQRVPYSGTVSVD